MEQTSLEEQLYEAVNLNDVSQCLALLEKGVEVNAYAHCGRTVLGRAVQLGHIECIQLLLNAIDYWKPTDGDRAEEEKSRRRCDINMMDYYARTPLHYAAELGDTRVLAVLLEAGCRVDVADSDNVTPLHLAACRGHADFVEIMLKSGCQVNRKTSDKTSALHVAAGRGHETVIERLIEYGAKIDVLDTLDRTPVLLAVNRANHEALEALVKHGAKVNIEEIHGYTPLAEAIWQKDERMVRLLLDAGAKVTKSHFLLHYCVMYRNFRLVELLLKSGCLINLRDDSGDTPLHIAARTGEVPILDILLRYGANVNYPNLVSGTSPLHEAVEGIRDCDHLVFLSVLEKLLEYGCKLTVESYTSGDYPLYRAILLEKFNVAASLIRYGCDVNKGYVFSCNVDNLCLARRKDNFKIAKMLVYGGFDMTRASWLEILPCDVIGYTSNANTLENWLVHIKTNPLNLSDICRIVIRRTAGDHAHKTISRLCLPKRLERYLLLEDV